MPPERIKASNLEVGKAGENAGISYLEQLGYEIVEINYRTSLGEIDCIAKDKNTLVFVEIKTRSSFDYGFPEEAVNRRKRQKLAQIAQFYLKGKGLVDRALVRFDVLAIFKRGDEMSFNHIQNAFETESK